MDLGLTLLGIFLILAGMLLMSISLRRRGSSTGLILIGPIPIVFSGNKPYLMLIPIIIIVIFIVIMVMLQ